MRVLDWQLAVGVARLDENLGANEQFRPAPTERRDVDVSREASALLTLVPGDAYVGRSAALSRR